MSVKKRINQKTHKDKSIRKSRKLMGGVKKDCLTLNDYNKKLEVSKIILENKVEKIEAEAIRQGYGISSQAVYNNTTSERDDINFYEKKIEKLNNLVHCKDEKSIIDSDMNHRRIFCTSCNSK